MHIVSPSNHHLRRKLIRRVIALVAAAVTATLAALSTPGAADAFTDSNPPAPATVPAYVLGENAGPSGASLDFGGTSVNRLSYYSGTQVVTVTDRIYRRSASSWVFVTSSSWTATLSPGYYFTSPKAHIPVAQLNAYGYGASVHIDWKTTAGASLTSDNIDYNSNSDYRCWNPYPNCYVANNNDGLGAYFIFPPIYF
jgi:hypothetical protein